MFGGGAQFHAVEFILARELHDQDRILGGKTNQHDQADLRQDVVVHPHDVHADNRRQQAHRHDQDDGERQYEALVIRRQQQENEQHREPEHQAAGVTRLRLLEGDLGPFVAHALGQDLPGELRHRLQALA